MEPTLRGKRPWKLREDSEGSKEFGDKVLSLQSSTGLSSITLRVLLQRGIDSPAAVESFLKPSLTQISDPFLIEDMNRAVNRVIEARDRSEKICVFGDYDVDGTCGAALLSWVFSELHMEFWATQPDRFKDGYGLNVAAVERAAENGARLLITVDCGITSFAAANRARELGLELIIIDHHQIDPVKGLPEAFAIVNPQKSTCPSGLKQLCGCGLAFYFSLALRAEARKRGWFHDASDEPNLKQHLDLVVVATAADQVPLVGDNRILVQQGLEVLRKTQKPGLRALMEVAGLDRKTLSPGSLGFVLGPRINASGRLKSAETALELLTTRDPMKGYELAQMLERLNAERAEIQNQIWDEVREKVEKGISEGRFKNGVVVASSGWHEGVVGIVASRVTETFHKPAAVIAIREDCGKGSVRSFGNKDVLEALRQSALTLKSFGGHRHAAGLSVATGQIDEFAAAFDEAIGRIQESADEVPLVVEGLCGLEELELKTLLELERLGPFGPGNPEPVFVFKARVQSHRVLKGRHLRLNLSPPGGARPVSAIFFHAAEDAALLDRVVQSQEKHWAAVPEVNRFRGQVAPSLRVRDIEQ